MGCIGICYITCVSIHMSCFAGIPVDALGGDGEGGGDGGDGGGLGGLGGGAKQAADRTHRGTSAQMHMREAVMSHTGDPWASPYR